MGWILFPTGIGWRDRPKQVGTGTFTCTNTRCKDRTAATQQYQVLEYRNWLVLLYLPVVPLNRLGVTVRCRSCKTLYSLDVLDPPQATASTPETGEETAVEASPPAADDLSGQYLRAETATRPTFCEECGARLREGKSFCVGCGTPIASLLEG